jgi:acetyl-CoA C-acetyltransferase
VAEQFNVSREEMDRFAQRSQEKAVAGQDSGFFSREIIPYPASNGVLVDRDDGPRRGSSLEKLGSLEASFKIGGRVTAGNSCSLSDGAAALVVMSDRRAKELGIQPLARIVGSSVSGIEPEIMGMGPVEAVHKVCRNTGMSLHDIEVVELNEAFAAQVLPVCRELGLEPFSDQVNPHGGAIALGHPYGMTGVRIVATLMNDLKTLNKSVGLATLCVGGGQGMAMVIERLT